MSKLTEQDPLPSALAQDDLIYVVRGSTSYKVTLGDFMAGFRKFVPGFEGYTIIPATGNVNPAIIEQNDILIGSGAYFNGEGVIMKALQDSPNEDAHFSRFLSGSI